MNRVIIFSLCLLLSEITIFSAEETKAFITNNCSSTVEIRYFFLPSSPENVPFYTAIEAGKTQECATALIIQELRIKDVRKNLCEAVFLGDNFLITQENTGDISIRRKK